MKIVTTLIAALILFGCNPKQSTDAEQQSPLTHLASPAVGNSSLPFLSKDQNNNLILSWVEKENDSTNLKFSTLDRDSWSAPIAVASGTDWFFNWADYPSILRSGNQMISHFLAKSSEGTYSYDVHLTQSGDNGQNWNSDFIPHNDGTPTEHGFVTLLPFEDQFFAAWLDGRNTEDSREEGGRGAMTVRGAFISATGELTGEALLDDRVCDCCQTGGAITENGPIIVYRDRSEDEIRDMSIVRYLDGQWTAPQSIHNDDWKIAGCPVNGPKASALGSSLVIAWFSAANQKSEVKVIFSNDNGENFNEVVVIDNTKPIGRVDVAMINENTAIVSWLDKSASGAKIKAAQISRDGKLDNIMTIAEISPSRKTGFPQMEVIGETVYFAWTRVMDGEASIKTASLSI